MKILKKIRNITRCPKHKNDKSITDQPSALLFHQVHGDNIRLSGNGAIAERLESFCEGIVFSSRPIKVGERVTIKFMASSTEWNGALRFGFTTTNPIKLKGRLPKYACPELTDKSGFWAKALSDRYAVVENVLSYWFDESGKAYYSINGDDKGLFLTDVDVSKSIWVLLDIYGSTTAIRFLDSRYICENRLTESIYSTPNHHHQPSSSSPSSSLPSPSGSSSSLPEYSTIRRTSAVNREPLPQIYRGNNLSPLPFHRTRGCNITLSSDGCVAERCDSQYSRGYVFSQRPLRLGEKMVIQILKTDELYTGSLAFGLTTCNPSTLNTDDLPDDPHILLDRPEYWIVIKDVANKPIAGDEIAFKITESGQVIMTKNRQPPITLMHIDQTQSFYPFFDLYGSTIKVKSLGAMMCEKVNSIKTNNQQNISQQQQLNLKQSPSSASQVTYYYSSPPHHQSRMPSKNMVTLRQKYWSTYGLSSENDSSLANLSPYQQSSTLSSCQTIPSSHSTGSLNVESECTVCFEAPINCVLYTCGHMCMCYDCAVKQWKGQNGGRCPLCRARILDVIRTYYA